MSDPLERLAACGVTDVAKTQEYEEYRKELGRMLTMDDPKRAAAMRDELIGVIEQKDREVRRANERFRAANESKRAFKQTGWDLQASHPKYNQELECMSIAADYWQQRSERAEAELAAERKFRADMGW